MKYLKIKERDKGKGESVFCSKCNRTINNTCKLSNKRIYTCKYPESHSFKASYHIPNTANSKITKHFETREYSVFQVEKLEFFLWLKKMNISAENLEQVRAIKEYNERNNIPLKEWVLELTEEDEAREKREAQIKKEQKEIEEAASKEEIPVSTGVRKKGKLDPNNKPMDYESVVQMFLDHMAGLDEIEIKANQRSEDYVSELATYYRYFAIALKKLKHHPAKFRIDEIGDEELMSFHRFLEDSLDDKGNKRFGAYSYNKGIMYMSKLFAFLNEKRNYNLIDPFKGIKRKSTSRKGKNDAIYPDEFAILLSKITEKNGWGTKLDRGHVRKVQHYRPWLKLAFKLAIETGERRDGLALMRWNDVDMKNNEIEIRNHKVSNIKKEEILRIIPITVGLKKVLKQLGYSKFKATDNYIIAPERENRSMVMQILSRSFTHFWKLTGIQKKSTMQFKRLRKTYATLMYIYFGESAKEITGQTIDNMTKNYVDKKLIMMKARNISFEKVYEDLQLAAEI